MPMQIVAGLSLKNLEPRVWDPASPLHLPELRAVMVSYAELHQMPARRRAAMQQGLRAMLDVPPALKIYLDNGAFYFLRRDGELPFDEYDAFVAAARPDWRPIPRDFIPSPAMSLTAQRDFLTRTMDVNRAYHYNGYAPVIHAGALLDEYIAELAGDARLAAKADIGVGGLVPNLLRAPRALPYAQVLGGLRRARAAFPAARLHLFGVGGAATLHLAALLGIDSLDSSGWRNRAARGIVQLPGRGDRMLANLGSWRGREPSAEEWELLAACPCPACRLDGLDGLRASKLAGFCRRATHNLWVLLDEARQIEEHLCAGDYRDWYPGHISNSIYRPLIDTLAQADWPS